MNYSLINKKREQILDILLDGTCTREEIECALETSMLYIQEISDTTPISKLDILEQ